MSIKTLIKLNEGLNLKPYRCPAGKLTIGYGRNLEDNGISGREADFMLGNDLAGAQRDLLAVFGAKYSTFSEEREAALMDMMFNLGLKTFTGFKKMIAAIMADDWEEAARQALDSNWARQVGQRAISDAKLFREV